MDLVGEVPTEPRRLRAPDRKKLQVYIELAQILLRKYPSESTARSVKFLIDLCQNDAEVGELCDLAWLQEPRAPARIDVGSPSALQRLAPVMTFNAQLRR